MEEDVKKVLAMVLLDNIPLSEIVATEDVIDEVSFYLGEAYDFLMVNYE
jgi:hypothetical protein